MKKLIILCIALGVFQAQASWLTDLEELEEYELEHIRREHHLKR